MAAALHVVATLDQVEDGNQSYHPNLVLDDLSDDLGVDEQGHLRVPGGPGLGIQVDESRVGSAAERYEADFAGLR